MKKILLFLISICIIFVTGCQNETVTSPKSNINDTVHNSAPYIVSVTVAELRAIKNAVNTMSEEDFKEYMYENHYGASVNGMNTIENAKFLMEEFEETTIPVLDEDETCFNKLLFYHERNEIQCVIPYTESIAMTFNIYTPKSDRKENGVFGINNSNAVLQKELNADNILASIYKTDTKDEFFIDVFADNTYIFVRTAGIQDIKDFEECFSRLEFVKTGDLLNETAEESSLVDKTEAEITLQEETEADTTTVVSEEATVPDQTETVTDE